MNVKTCDHSIPKEILLRKKLGAGAFGIAYSWGRGKAIKLTSNHSEFDNSCKILGQKFENVWQVYEVGMLCENCKKAVARKHYRRVAYWIVGERLYKPTNDDLGGRKKYNRDSPYYKLKTKVTEQLAKVGACWHDSHTGNVMKTKQGVLKAIDLMG